ncbi:MAG TPA: hypothetical protein VGL56_04875 [Fimbriimonadaceae bacterium]|jgi:hypothetical protein
MKQVRLFLVSIFTTLFCSVAFSQPTTLCWSARLVNGTADTYANFTVFGSNNSVLVCSTVVESGKPDLIKVQEFDQYGNLIHTATITSTGTATPVGFATDPMGDCFLIYNEYDSTTFMSSEMMSGWNYDLQPLFSKVIAPLLGDGISGLGLSTDANNNVYGVFKGQTTQSGVQFRKFTRLGVQVYSKEAAFVGTYAQFDPTGRCCVLGYRYSSVPAIIGPEAAIFNPADGSLQHYFAPNNTATSSYYFGGGTFDSAGDLFLNLATSTSTGTTSVANCYSPTFTHLWYTAPFSGFAWYAAAKNPMYSYAYGSSDVYNSTGQFIANTSNGSLVFNETTQGQPIGWVGVDDTFAAYIGPDGSVHALTIDPKTGNTADLVVAKSPSGVQANASVSVGRVDNSWQSQTVTVTQAHHQRASARPNGEPGPTDPPTTGGDPSLYGCFVYMVRSAFVLNTITVPRLAYSGFPFTITVGANAPLTTGSLTIPLTVTNGTFSNGLTTENVVITAPAQTVNTTINVVPTAAPKTLVITGKQGGVTRTTSIIEYAPAFYGITMSSTVIAFAATTLPYTVTANGIAATGGVGVTITSSNTAVIPNGAATILAGNEAVSSSLTVNRVTSTKTVSLTFTLSTGHTLVRTVTVNP